MAGQIQGTDSFSLGIGHLECPVCFKIPRDDIFMCSESHTICPGCFENLASPKRCHSCRQLFPVEVQRNRPLEKMIAELTELEFECKFTKWGCDMSATRQSLAGHERGCSFQPFHCPLKQCNELVTMRAFSAHCSLEKHNGDMTDFGVQLTNRLSLSIWPVQLPKMELRPCMWKWKGISFVKHCQYAEEANAHYYWVAVAGNERQAEKYKCEIAIVNEHIEPVYKFKGPVHSIDKRVGFIAETNQGLLLSREDFYRYRRWYPNEKKSKLRIDITISESKI